MSNRVKIGWSEVSITPERRVMLEGQFYDRISQYVESPITVTSLAIESDGEQAVFCSADCTHVTDRLTAMVRDNVRAYKTDLNPEKIIINATHTHTSGLYNEDLGLKVLMDYLGVGSAPCFGKGNVFTDNVMTPEEVIRFFAERIAKSAVEAWENRRDGGYIPAFGRAAVGMNRRVTYKDGSAKMWGDSYTEDFFALEGGNDNGIEMLFIYGEGKEPTGVVLNIACPSQVLEQRYFISSDYWGKVRMFLRKRFGDNFRVLALCSPAGDQCPRDLVRWVEPETPIEDPNVIRDNPPARRADPSAFDIKGCTRIGRRIANEVCAIYDEDVAGSDITTEAVLCHHSEMMKLPLRRVTEEENAHARKELADFAATHDKTALDFHDTCAMHVWAGIAERYKEQQTKENVEAEVHVIRLGDVAFASDPFEYFLDFANVIRARSAAKQTFLIQLANGAMGYLPTEKAENGGHYSAYVSSGCVGHEGGYILAENTLKLIEKQFKE